MSWNSSAILIRAEDLPDDVLLLRLLGFPNAVEIGPIGFDEATSVGVQEALDGHLGAAVARVEGWASIWGPMLVADPDVVAHLSRGGAAFTLIFEGSTGTAGFEWYRDGHLLRRWAVHEGTILNDEGDPLPGEGDAPSDGEGWILSLLSRLALPLGMLAEGSYTLYQFSD